MAVNFDNDITSRIERLRKQQMAASMGKTVEQMDQDREYFNEIKEIEIQDKMDSEAEENAAMDAGAEETAANDAAFAERPWYSLRESSNVTMPEPDSEFDDSGFFDSGSKTMEESFRFGDTAEKGQAGYKEMYPESYKDSVRSDKMSGLSREREIYYGSPVDKMRNRQQELERKVSRGEMTRGEAEESFENYRQGLFKEINLEKAGAFSGEFQGVGVMPEKPATEPRITGYVEEPEVEALEAASEKEGLMPIGDAEAQIDEMAAAGEQSDIQRDENNPAVKQMKEIQTNDEVRKEVLKDVPKEEIAMVKEELGNYYIGPGGYAINLDKVDERKEQFKREAKFSMLQYIPDHAKPQMLASWGFIDQEDVDNSPDDPKVQAEHIKAASALAVQEMIKAGLINVAQINSDGTFRNTQERSRSAEEIAKGQYTNNTDLATMNNKMRKEVKQMDLDWNKVKLDADKVMHMDDNDLKKWSAELGANLKLEEMHMLRDHFKKEMKFKYSKIRGVEKFQTAQLGQQNEQFKLTHGLKTTDQQQGWLVKQHTMMLQKAKQLLDNGNPTAAMMVYKAAGTDIEIDIPGFWKQQAKTSAFSDKKVSAAFSAMGYSGTGLSTGINKFVAEQGRIEKMFKKPGRNDETGLNNIEDWVNRNKNNKVYGGKLGEPWTNMTPEAQNAYPGGYPAWENEMVAKAIKYEMGRSQLWGNVYKTINAKQINITRGNETETTTVESPEVAVEEGPGAGTSPVTSTPLVDIENQVRDKLGYGKKHVGNLKQRKQERVSDDIAFKKSLKEGEKRAKQMLGGARKNGKAKRFQNMQQIVDHYRENSEELADRGIHFQHYILTQIQKYAGER